MFAALARLEPQAYALMRAILGFLFLWHGSQKLLNFPIEMPAGAPPFIVYTAGSIELFGGILVMIGLFTRGAAFLCSGLMACAYWMAHGHKALLPIANGGELAVIYCFAFLFIATRGAGDFSVDQTLAK